MNMDTLEDWGEFRVLEQIVLPTVDSKSLPQPLGDDCAYVPLSGCSDSLVITSDVAPIPLVWNLGHESYWTWGWYAVAINLSDLAAAGAKPLAFASSVEAPASMRVSQFREFFEGMGAACREYGVPNAGGNIRAAPRFECHGMALGTVPAGTGLTRRGCKPGDSIVVIGDCGRFITAYLRAEQRGMDCLSDEAQNVLIRPRPKIREMLSLREAAIVHAATDNSDGILGSLMNIAERSNCSIEVEMRDELVPNEVASAARENGLDPWNLMFFWGDWQVIVAVAEESLATLQSVADEKRCKVVQLGRAISGPPVVYGIRGGQRARFKILRNENFISSSYNVAVTDHLNYMLRTPLFE